MWSHGAGAAADGGGLLGKLNGDQSFDFADTLLSFFGNDPDSNPYFDDLKKHSYVDTNELFTNNIYKSSPLMLSVNIQSLNSKFNALDSFIADLFKNNVDISLVALQEIWQIDHPDLFKINGFNFFHSQRRKNKGGGVGFYINSDLSCRVVPDLSVFHEKIFEFCAYGPCRHDCTRDRGMEGAGKLEAERYQGALQTKKAVENTLKRKKGTVPVPCS